MEDKEICRNCKDVCCKDLPGIFHPDDLETLDIAFISTRLQSSIYAVDSWDADESGPEIFFLRPAVVGSHRLLDRSWGGTCVYLTETGCSLEHDLRPRTCRELVPVAGSEPCCGVTKHEGAMWWQDHQNLLLTAIKHAQHQSEIWT